jgi:hypothetical protein
MRVYLNEALLYVVVYNSQTPTGWARVKLNIRSDSTNDSVIRAEMCKYTRLAATHRGFRFYCFLFIGLFAMWGSSLLAISSATL